MLVLGKVSTTEIARNTEAQGFLENKVVAPKWKIASDSRGYGNTANIGSIKNITDLKTGNGVFSQLGEDWFDEYWINYGVATMVKSGKSIPITNIWDFLEFKGRTYLFDKIGNGAKKRKE